MKIINALLTVTLLATPLFAAEKKMSGKGDPVATVKALEESWDAAAVKKDTKTLASLIADDFIGVSSENKFVDKAGAIAANINDEKVTSAKLLNTKTRAFGPALVVQVGDSQDKGTDKAGKPFNRVYRYTDTWALRNGSWQCVAEQVSLLQK